MCKLTFFSKACLSCSQQAECWHEAHIASAQQSSQNTARSLWSVPALQNKLASLCLLPTASRLFSSPTQINQLHLRRRQNPQKSRYPTWAALHSPSNRHCHPVRNMAVVQHHFLHQGSWLPPAQRDGQESLNSQVGSSWQLTKQYPALSLPMPQVFPLPDPHSDLNFLYLGKSIAQHQLSPTSVPPALQPGFTWRKCNLSSHDQVTFVISHSWEPQPISPSKRWPTYSPLRSLFTVHSNRSVRITYNKAHGWTCCSNW